MWPQLSHSLRNHGLLKTLAVWNLISKNEISSSCPKDLNHSNAETQPWFSTQFVYLLSGVVFYILFYFLFSPFLTYILNIDLCLSTPTKKHLYLSLLYMLWYKCALCWLKYCIKLQEVQTAHLSPSLPVKSTHICSNSPSSQKCCYKHHCSFPYVNLAYP